MFNRILLSLFCASALTAGAQTMIVNFADSADCSKASLKVSLQKGQNKFDARQVSLDRTADNTLTLPAIDFGDMPLAPAWLNVGHTSIPVILQPGTTLEVKVPATGDGEGAVSFSGPNALASDYFGKYEDAFRFNKYIAFTGDSISVIPGSDTRLDNEYASLVPELDKLPAGETRDFLAHLTDDACLATQVRLCGKDRSRVGRLLADVDVNSWIGLYNYLPIWKFERSLPETDYKSDMAPWGNIYIKAIADSITEPAVREALLDQCARKVLEWGHCDNLDDFWLPFVAVAGDSSRVVKQYAPKIESLRRTRVGMRAIDFAFYDKDGVEHHLSDFFGKLLYIDVWASWCGPCRKETPYLVSHYNEYYKNNDKVEFISISVDEDRDSWIKALEADKPVWGQYNVSGDAHKFMSKAYGINSIPRFMIIGADGTIVSADTFRPSADDFRFRLDALIAK